LTLKEVFLKRAYPLPQCQRNSCQASFNESNEPGCLDVALESNARVRQWHSAATPPPFVISMPIPAMSGTLKMLVPRKTIDLEVAPRVRRTFRLAKALVVVGPDGKIVEPSTVTAGGKVTVHFLQDGKEAIIDRIFLQ
jgi:hypothetical protein